MQHHWHLDRRYAQREFYDGIIGGMLGQHRDIEAHEIITDDDPVVCVGGRSITASTVDPRLVAFFSSLKHGGANSTESDDVIGADDSTESDDDATIIVSVDDNVDPTDIDDTNDTFFDHVIEADVTGAASPTDDTFFDHVIETNDATDAASPTAADLFDD